MVNRAPAGHRQSRKPRLIKRNAIIEIAGITLLQSSLPDDKVHVGIPIMFIIITENIY